jgi:hypothetical protein
MGLKEEFTNLGNEVREIISTVKNQANVWKNAVDREIKTLEDWRNANDVERVSKFSLDLTMLDANTMYPIVFRFGYGPQEQQPLAELNIGRYYYWNARSPSPFSDNSSTTHIAGLVFRAVGQGYPWDGSGWHGARVEIYDTSYMRTLQLFNFSARVYHQAKGDTTFTSDNSVKPTKSCPVYSAMYVRGGLLYKGTVKGMGVPSLYTSPKKIYDNFHHKCSEWVAPFPYITENNMTEVNNYGA